MVLQQFEIKIRGLRDLSVGSDILMGTPELSVSPCTFLVTHGPFLFPFGENEVDLLL